MASVLNINSFMVISSFVNNSVGTIAPLGELSTQSLTYAKEKGEYLDSDNPGFRLTVFKAVDTITGQPSVLSIEQVKENIDIIKIALVYARSHVRPYDPEDFRNTLIAQFYGKVSNIQIGDFKDNGSLALPEWISWMSISNNGNYNKVWLSDEAFQDQYDGYEIVVIPPLEPVDGFFGFFNVVSDKIAETDMAALSTKIQNIKDEYPESYLRFLTFDYRNVNNTSQVTPTNWTVLIYGKAGDNTDAIKDAIIAHVLSNSTHSRDEWETIIPDLFKRTEFILIPVWNKISIPNLTNLSALYSSMLNPTEVIAFAKTMTPFYAESHTQENIVTMPYDYKALSMIVVNGPNNVASKAKIGTLFPDYIPVPTSSIDFNRMSVKTRDWVLAIENLIIEAESITQYSSVHNNHRRIWRNGIMFMAIMINNVNYLMAAKINSQYGV